MFSSPLKYQGLLSNVDLRTHLLAKSLGGTRYCTWLSSVVWYSWVHDCSVCACNDTLIMRRISFAHLISSRNIQFYCDPRGRRLWLEEKITEPCYIRVDHVRARLENIVDWTLNIIRCRGQYYVPSTCLSTIATRVSIRDERAWERHDYVSTLPPLQSSTKFELFLYAHFEPVCSMFHFVVLLRPIWCLHDL